MSMDQKTYIIGAQTMANQIGVTRQTLIRWVKEGKISASKPGRQYIFERKTIEKQLAGTVYQHNNNMEL
jgi:excisionase family DNA binding protein